MERKKLSKAHRERYRQIVEVLLRHGFGAFFSGLKLGALLSIRERLFSKTDQIANAESPATHFRSALEELGGTFVKLGQVLSTRPDLLPAGFLEELSKLQDQAPRIPWPDAKDVLETELDAPVEETFLSVDPSPLASASLGQVHAAVLPAFKTESNGDVEPARGTNVVIKIQRPGIEKSIQVDLDIMFDLARRFKDSKVFYHIADPVDIVEQFSDALTAELDYKREGQRAERFYENFEGEPNVCVPRINWDYTTRRILVMERLYGIKINNCEALDHAGIDRKRIAETLAHLYLKSIFEDHFFHADPHPGNVWVMDDHVIALLDFGRMGTLTDRDEEQLGYLTEAVLEKNPRKTVERLLAIEGVVQGHVDRQNLELDVSHLMKKYVDISLEEIQLTEILREVVHVAASHHLHLPGNWVMLVHAVAILEGVLAQLDPELDIFALARPYMMRIKRKRMSPGEWLPPLLEGGADWISLWKTFPQQAAGLLESIGQGRLSIEVNAPDIKKASEVLDRAANRITISLLVASLIMAIGLILPLLDVTHPWPVATWLVIIGFAVTLLLGFWLAISIWQANRG